MIDFAKIKITKIANAVASAKSSFLKDQSYLICICFCMFNLSLVFKNFIKTGHLNLHPNHRDYYNWPG